MANIGNKYRVHEVAKDFGLPTKQITEILTEYAQTPKNHMQVLEDHELSLIFEYLTQHNPVSGIQVIFAEGMKPAAEKKAGRRDLILGGICCGIALALACNLQQLGMVAGASAGKTSFITTLYVVLVPICGLFLKKKVSPTVWISVLLAVAGLYCLCIKEDFTIAPSDLLVMLCAFGYTLHILVIDYFTQRVDGVKMSCIQFLTCAILSAILMLIFENPTWADIVPCMGSVLYVGVFSSGVAYTLQILAQKDSNPTIVALLLSLESVFGAVSGAIFLHETMTGKELIGCVLMLIAVVLAQLDLPLKKRDKSAKEA